MIKQLYPIAIVAWLSAGLAHGQQPDTAAATDPQFQSGYVLGPDDQIQIRGLNLEELSDKPVIIGTSGNINLPLIGRMHVTGLSVEQLEAAIAERLKTYVYNPQVSIQVTEFRSQPVSVIGNVGSPGIVQLRGRKNLYEILSMAGGLRPDAGYRLRITRRLENGQIPLPDAKDDPTGQFSVVELDVKEVVEVQSPEKNIEIKPNDVISVPKADMVYVVGEVKLTGAVPLTARRTVSALELVSIAGGLSPTAAPKKAKILRTVSGSPERQEIAVNLKDVISGKAGDVSLQANDILLVPSSTGKKIVAIAIPSIITSGTSASIYGAGR